MDEETKRCIAANEVRFRSANERIDDAAKRYGAEEGSLPFICECGRPACVTVIRATRREYEGVRANPHYFMCAPGHQITAGGIARVVEETENFVVVEKLGVAAEVADANDIQSG